MFLIVLNKENNDENIKFSFLSLIYFFEFDDDSKADLTFIIHFILNDPIAK